MKKVLILAYDFPPYVSVGGLRPYNWYKYFHEFGVYPIVITRQWDNEHGNHLDYVAESESSEVIREITETGKIIRTPYKPNWSNRMLTKHGDERYVFPRKIVTAYFEFAQFIYSTGPKVELYKAAKEYLTINKVDAIIATGDPFVLFLYASKLSSQFNVPWIADYRDPWSQNLAIQNRKYLKVWSAFFERKTLENVRFITTVSDFLIKTIRKNVPNKEFHVIMNGYDPESIESVSEIKPSQDLLEIAFVGTIYNWHPIESVLREFSSFCINESNILLRINFFGINKLDFVQDMIDRKYPVLKSYTSFIPKISNKKLLNKLATQHVMLLFNDYSILGTKIFDYIGIRRKIILCYANDKNANKLKEKHYTIEEVEGISNQLQADLIHETNSGIVVENANHLRKVLRELHDEFTQTGSIACDSVHVENYSRKIQVQKLAELIDQLER